MTQCRIFWHLPRKREKKIYPHREGKNRNGHLAFWENSDLREELKEKEKKKLGNNEFIKLKMHRPMERLDFNRRQMEREPPLLLRCSDTAALIAWSCLGDTKSSWAMTWGEQAPGFVVRKIVYLTSTTSIIPLLYLASRAQLHPSLLGKRVPGITSGLLQSRPGQLRIRRECFW